MEWASGNVYIRRMPGELDKVGDEYEGHSHNFDHTTICMRGSVEVSAVVGGSEKKVVLIAPDAEHGDSQCHCLVKAGIVHKIKALAPNSIVWCVYSHRNAQGEVVQQYEGWVKPYV